MPVDAPSGTIVVYSDLSCPWAHLAVHRLFAARTRLHLDDRVRFEHRPFPLEILNGEPIPKPVVDAEVPVVGALDPDAGWATWQAPASRFAVSMLPALEAVQAAQAGSAAGGEQLDRALRRAFFADSRCITMVHEILAVAADCDAVDVDALERALWDGTHRRDVVPWLDDARDDTVQGSPHLFLADGTDVHNPGITKRWAGDPYAGGFPVVDADDPSVYDDLLRRAAA